MFKIVNRPIREGAHPVPLADVLSCTSVNFDFVVCERMLTSIGVQRQIPDASSLYADAFSGVGGM